MNEQYDLVVVGGGPAGLAAAIAAQRAGLTNILIVERDQELGGILNQCIHGGFGLHRFSEELTGPEYAGRYIELLQGSGISVALESMVLSLTPDRQLHLVSREEGYRVITAGAVVLAMGCRERTRGAIAIPGTRPAGVLTAGAAQRYVNMEGYLPGKRVVILGSGDIGLIMARRMTLEGAKVLACVELMPYSGGLTRNIVQCLEDYGIPLYLSHTITEIKGRGRLSGVTVAKVDENRQPIPGSEMAFDCDTLLLSVGLIPENELSRQAGVQMDTRTGGPVVSQSMETSIPGVFACGNVAHVHDLVDFVSAESEKAGAAAAAFVLKGAIPTGNKDQEITVLNGNAVTYTVPQIIRTEAVEKSVELFFRVNHVLGSGKILVRSQGEEIATYSRTHMAPGEMERLVIPKVILSKAKKEIVIEVTEVVS